MPLLPSPSPASRRYDRNDVASEGLPCPPEAEAAVPGLTKITGSVATYGAVHGAKVGAKRQGSPHGLRVRHRRPSNLIRLVPV
ncbi:hypothetical protein GCM10023223_14110 [Stackebrandtia albiflava]